MANRVKSDNTTTKSYSQKDYEQAISALIGKAVEVIPTAPKSIKSTVGKVEYVSRDCFGVKVSAPHGAEYVVSFCYIDLFCRKIALKVL